MSTIFRSQSPIDGRVVWEGRQSSVAEISEVMRRADVARRIWRAASVDDRADIARRYAKYLESHQAEIARLLSIEVGKLEGDARGEVQSSIAKVENTIRSLEQRRSTTREDSGDVSRVVRYRPLGVVLVLGPFNFPLHLPGAQIIPALIAGNTVVFKPSEQATAVGQWMRDAWLAAGLPQDVLQMIVGGADVAKAAVDCPEVGGVFLTGSRRAGLSLRQQLVARYDVLLAMELGGNNPIVIDNAVDENVAAAIVSHSAFVSSGQRCSCARRAIVVAGPNQQNQIDAIVERTMLLRIGMPGDTPVPQLGPLISLAAADHLMQTFEDFIALGCKMLLAPQRDARYAMLISPGIVDASRLSLDAYRTIGDHEWFGPLLVIRRVASFDAAIESATATSYGLTAALIGGDELMFERFAVEVGAGVVNWNRGTTGAAGVQPFGGLGNSGNHRPAGFFAIDSCSDPVASIETPLPPADPW